MLLRQRNITYNTICGFSRTMVKYMILSFEEYEIAAASVDLHADPKVIDHIV